MKKITKGALIIGTQGCTYDILLMCSGSENGKIVYIDWNLMEDRPPYFTDMTFEEWMLGYFQKICKGESVQAYGYS